MVLSSERCKLGKARDDDRARCRRETQMQRRCVTANQPCVMSLLRLLKKSWAVFSAVAVVGSYSCCCCLSCCYCYVLLLLQLCRVLPTPKIG